MAGKAAAAAATPRPPLDAGFVLFVSGWILFLTLLMLHLDRDDTYGLTSRCVVTLDTTTTVVASLATVTAAFGPSLPPGGVQGVLFRLADGCSPAQTDKDGHAWIALMEKGNCSFHDKVLNAQLAGAAAAIVYNNEDNQPLMLMTSQNASDIRMSSVFMSKADGQLLCLVNAGSQQTERVAALLKLDIGYMFGDNLLTVLLSLLGSLGVAFGSLIICAAYCRDSNPVDAPLDEKDGEDAAVVVNCEAASPLASAVTSDGLSKLEEGKGALTISETAPCLLQDHKRQHKVDRPPLYCP